MKRRDFLKLAGLLPGAYYLPKSETLPTRQGQNQSQNYIILVCDAWSASNISLYGYPRKTTPFLEKLSEKAIVFHNHYAAGNYTYPGTTGLLTGLLQWEHRNLRESYPTTNTILKNNLFSLFESHNRIAYTHNQIADRVIQRMLPLIDYYKPRQELYVDEDFWLAKTFQFDFDNASTAWERVIMKFDDGYANSLFLSRVYSLLNNKVQQEIYDVYPLGLPSVGGNNKYQLETAVNWIAEQSNSVTQPYIAYYHLLPPHTPYNTRIEFYDSFLDDGYSPLKKSEHILTEDVSYKRLIQFQRRYDEYILLVDSEINRLYTLLSENGALENTWLIITSDHGEMFERGIKGHRAPTFHNPLIHVPLIILPPGQKERMDIYTPTNAIDLIPTLLHLTGKNIPDWLEGEILPPYNPNPDPDRPIFSTEGVYDDFDTPFTSGAVMMRQGDYKLTYLFGDESKFKALEGREIYELYNLNTDPEELDNLYDKQPEIAQQMQETMFAEMEKHDAR